MQEKSLSKLIAKKTQIGQGDDGISPCVGPYPAHCIGGVMCWPKGRKEPKRSSSPTSPSSMEILLDATSRFDSSSYTR